MTLVTKVSREATKLTRNKERHLYQLTDVLGVKMGKKRNKRKLTEDQKRWLKRLEEFVSSPFFRYTGNQDLKEVVEGKFVVVHADTSTDPETGKFLYEDGEWDAYSVVVGADDYPGVEAIAKWNPSPRNLIVNLDSFEIIKEVRRMWTPKEFGIGK